MSALNILNVSSIYGNTEVLNVTTSETSIVTNTANSGKVYKVNTLLVSNIDKSNNDSITAKIVRDSVGYSVANTITVPINSTLILLSKDTNIYLQEGDSLQLKANSNNTLQSVCSFEVIG